MKKLFLSLMMLITLASCGSDGTIVEVAKPNNPRPPFDRPEPEPTPGTDTFKYSIQSIAEGKITYDDKSYPELVKVVLGVTPAEPLEWVMTFTDSEGHQEYAYGYVEGTNTFTANLALAQWEKLNDNVTIDLTMGSDFTSDTTDAPPLAKVASSYTYSPAVQANGAKIVVEKNDLGRGPRHDPTYFKVELDAPHHTDLIVSLYVSDDRIDLEFCNNAPFICYPTQMQERRIPAGTTSFGMNLDFASQWQKLQENVYVLMVIEGLEDHTTPADFEFPNLPTDIVTIDIKTVADLRNIENCSSNLYKHTDPTKDNQKNCSDRYLNLRYRLMNDLDFAGATWTPFAKRLRSNSLSNNSGAFIGNGFTIRNIKIVGNGKNVGLFSEVENGHISGLTLENVEIVAPNALNVGTFAGSASGKFTGLQVKNLKVTTSLPARTHVGGIFGYINTGNVTFSSLSTSGIADSHLESTALVGGSIGGLVGKINMNARFEISDSFATNSKIIGSPNTTSDGIGGLVGSSDVIGAMSGSAYYTTMSDNYLNNVEVISTNLNAGMFIGGIVGFESCLKGGSHLLTIKNSYANASYSGDSVAPSVTVGAVREYEPENPYIYTFENVYYNIDGLNSGVLRNQALPNTANARTTDAMQCAEKTGDASCSSVFSGFVFANEQDNSGAWKSAADKNGLMPYLNAIWNANQ